MCCFKSIYLYEKKLLSTNFQIYFLNWKIAIVAHSHELNIQFISISFLICQLKNIVYEYKKVYAISS